jgi:hypothetical protein
LGTVHALADHLAEALSRGAMHLALAAGELLVLAHACAVLAAEAHALERVALRQAVPLLGDHPRRHHLCSTNANMSWRASYYSSHFANYFFFQIIIHLTFFTLNFYRSFYSNKIVQI